MTERVATTAERHPRSPSPSRRIVLALVIALLFALPATALAHLHLKRSDPASGARIRSAPVEIRLWFTDPPELAMTSVKLTTVKGAAVRTGPLRALDGDRSAVAAAIPDRLAPGAYTVNWRGASADGYPMRGHFSFVIDAASGR